MSTCICEFLYNYYNGIYYVGHQIKVIQYWYFLLREIVKKFGLWDQLRVDHGTEWYLMLSVNAYISHLRNTTDREPQVQTSSKLV